ncbi:hypothetical protein GCM10022251_50470 [Phytohabitans flavus]
MAVAQSVEAARWLAEFDTGFAAIAGDPTSRCGDGGPADDRSGVLGYAFVVAGQAPVGGQPGQGSLDQPPERVHGEAPAGRVACGRSGPWYRAQPTGEASVGEHVRMDGAARVAATRATRAPLAPSRSCQEAARTHMVISRPNVSLTMNRLRPLIFLPAS